MEDADFIDIGVFSLSATCQCQFNVFRIFWDSQNSRLLNFWRCKSRECGCHVIYGSTFKLSRKDAHTGSTDITLRDTASVFRNKWGEKIQNYRFLDLLRDY